MLCKLIYMLISLTQVDGYDTLRVHKKNMQWFKDLYILIVSQARTSGEFLKFICTRKVPVCSLDILGQPHDVITVAIVSCSNHAV